MLGCDPGVFEPLVFCCPPQILTLGGADVTLQHLATLSGPAARQIRYTVWFNQSNQVCAEFGVHGSEAT